MNEDIRLQQRFTKSGFKRNKKGQKVYRDERGKFISEMKHILNIRETKDHNVTINRILGHKKLQFGDRVSKEEYNKELATVKKESVISKSVTELFSLFRLGDRLREEDKEQDTFKDVKIRGFKLDKETGFVKDISKTQASIGNIREIAFKQKQQRELRDSSDKKERERYERGYHWLREARWKMVQAYYSHHGIEVTYDGSKFIVKGNERIRID